ncbi:MAG: Nitrogen-fixing NifU domain protein [uncultured Aureispira sp.]|uniref:Nitrogen-fixing NifU domain protein n=1 Tax=uncultured Aureispira sp. TaxID=1331704 RepID=A0A6S6TRJ4_9BACT|nr:MAG: Nitrogen-fixing NifU domain protein [uncultured Aureispira sp.]
MDDKKMTKPPVMLYTEQTPNPETLKFVTNQMMYARKMADFPVDEKELAAEWSPLATELFKFEYVQGVYICNNFVTISKSPEVEWPTIMMELKTFIKTYIEDGKVVMKEGFEEVKAKLEAEEEEQYTGDDAELVGKIKQLLDKYVRPAVEMDGGNIKFHSFDKGVVNVILQGSCSGCPSSSGTLKVGIEGMLKRMVPEVTSVEAIMG